MLGVGDVQVAIGLLYSRYQAVVVVADAAVFDGFSQQGRTGFQRHAAKDHFLGCQVFGQGSVRLRESRAKALQPGVGADDLDAVVGEEAVGGLGNVDAFVAAQDGYHVHAVLLPEVELP